MIISKTNKHLAKKYIGKEMVFWTNQKGFYSNVYIAKLINVSSFNFFFQIDRESLKIKERRVDNCIYQKEKGYVCFQFCSPYINKDEKGNFLFDFI